MGISSLTCWLESVVSRDLKPSSARFGLPGGCVECSQCSTKRVSELKGCILPGKSEPEPKTGQQVGRFRWALLTVTHYSVENATSKHTKSEWGGKKKTTACGLTKIVSNACSGGGK